ncbi:MAG: S8 family peptidase [Candidatus Hydrogenedentes bacterium]|nr:S8 family peptidase [Candidatus Hydrogenedentota bacterium]
MTQGTRRIGFFFFLAMLCASGAVWAQAKPKPVPDFDYETITYYEGARTVKLNVALDELVAAAPGGGALNRQGVASAAGGATVEDHAGGALLVRYQSPSANLDGLKERAAVLAASNLEVDAIGYSTSDVVRDRRSRRRVTKRIGLKLKPGVDLAQITRDYNVRLVKKLEFAPDTYLCEAISRGLLDGIDAANAIHESGLVEFATPMIERWRVPRLIPNDPMYPSQWHLENTGQASGSHVAGNDVNINGAWDSVTGSGVNIAVTDTGVQVTHEDLAGNARTDIDLDINGGDNDPTPSSASHGTSVAGIAAAVGNNNVGVTGAAFDAGIVGIRLIEGAITDADEATAMGHNVSPGSANDRVHINTNSWGPFDDGLRLETWGPLTAAAVANAIANGRGGLGTIYTWAAGNGRASSDNVNYDGYASSRYTIAVGATGGDGVYSWYSEPGASMLVNTPSQDDFAGTTTTAFPDNYTSIFGGTSSAAPLAAGIIALLLEAKPGLSWRDVQHVLVDTAAKNDPGDGGWLVNGDGRDFNHAYGFGRIDAGAALSAAAGWLGVPAEATPLVNSETVSVAIPDDTPSGVVRTLDFSSAPNGFVVEAVEVTFNATHPYRGDLKLELTSPAGTTSVLSEAHFDFNADYNNWVFTSVAHWGEDPQGTWSMRVADVFPVDTGTWTDWTVTIHGFVLAIGAPPVPAAGRWALGLLTLMLLAAGHAIVTRRVWR